MQLDYAVVDAFAEEAFAGNPAAVVIEPPDAHLTDELRLKIAREFNLSETAFLQKLPSSASAKPEYSLRWFSPAQEVALCGHATIAASHILFSGPHPDAAEITYENPFAGTLKAAISNDKKIWLDFPVLEYEIVEDKEEMEKLQGMIGKMVPECKGKVVDLKRKPGLHGSLGLLVELEKNVDLAHVKVNIGAVEENNASLALTVASPDPQYHSLCRFFAPVQGIPEDPVTGSLTCALAPHWIQNCHRLNKEPNKGKDGFLITNQQVSARTGKLEGEWIEAKGRVKIGGKGIRTRTGTMFW